MDIISHGLWGGIAFGRANPKQYWSAFAFGIAPDMLSFGLLFVQNMLGFGVHPDFSGGAPDPSLVPRYIHDLYNVTHSLVIAAAVVGLVCLARRKLPLVMLAWPLHILVDIPTHAASFFPTPYLWPLANLPVNGIPWSHWHIFYPNLILLAAAYGVWWYIRRRS